MNQLKEHIIFKTFALVLALTLFTPIIVKLSHVFEHHEHEICITPNSKHFHKSNLECSFHSFKLNKQFYYKLYPIETLEINQLFQPILSQYHFLSEFQTLQFSLRGPPLFV